MIKTLHIPFFAGFYGTIFDSSDAEYYAIQEEIDYYLNELHVENLDKDKFTFDWKQRQEDIAESFTDNFWDEYGNKVPFIDAVKYNYIDSPMHYNFRNDELYADFDFKEDWKDCVEKFIEENKEWLRSEIKERWSSRDGFISFMSNDIDEWPKYLFDEEDERYIGEIIKYMLIKDEDFDKIMDHLEDYTYEDICDSQYVSYEG